MSISQRPEDIDIDATIEAGKATLVGKGDLTPIGLNAVLLLPHLVHQIHVLNGMLPQADRFDLCQPCGGAFWGRPGLGVCLGLDFSKRRCSTCGTIRPEPATPRVR